MRFLQRAQLPFGAQWISIIGLLFVMRAHCNDTVEHGRVRRSYTNRTTDGTTKGCTPCATCAAPCAVSTPAPPISCTDNPCYFPSLPYACSAEQCQEFINTTTGANGNVFPAKIVNLPETLCVTSCQVYPPSDSSLGFTIHRFGVCSRDIDLSPTREKIQNDEVEQDDNVESSLDCGNPCFTAEEDAIVVSHSSSCNPDENPITADIVLQCVLKLEDSDEELLATRAFKLLIQYIPPSECGVLGQPPEMESAENFP